MEEMPAGQVLLFTSELGDADPALLAHPDVRPFSWPGAAAGRAGPRPGAPRGRRAAVGRGVGPGPALHRPGQGAARGASGPAPGAGRDLRHREPRRARAAELPVPRRPARAGRGGDPARRRRARPLPAAARHGGVRDDRRLRELPAGVRVVAATRAPHRPDAAARRLPRVRAAGRDAPRPHRPGPRRPQRAQGVPRAHGGLGTRRVRWSRAGGWWCATPPGRASRTCRPGCRSGGARPGRSCTSSCARAPWSPCRRSGSGGGASRSGCRWWRG